MVISDPNLSITTLVSELSNLSFILIVSLPANIPNIFRVYSARLKSSEIIAGSSDTSTSSIRSTLKFETELYFS